MTATPVRVAICDDSKAYAEGLRRFLETDPRLRVVAIAGSGDQLLNGLGDSRPNLVTVEVARSGDGVETIRRLATATRAAIVAVSAHIDDADDPLIPAALAAGAVSAIDKAQLRLVLRLTPRAVALRERLVRLAGGETAAPLRPPKPLASSRRAERRPSDGTRECSASRPVPRRQPPNDHADGAPAARPAAADAAAPASANGNAARPAGEGRLPRPGVARIVGVAASAGGPNALVDVLGVLPPSFPLPILVVQHIAVGFAAGLANWLDAVIALEVRLARGGELPRPGVAIAPDGAHLVLAPDGRLQLDRRPPRGAHQPSADALLGSLAAVAGRGAVAVVLTGMGRDGAAGVAAIRSAGGVALAERSEHAHLAGMPVAAADAGATPLERGEIGRTLAALAVRR